MLHRGKSQRAALLLLLTSVIWGVAFVAQRDAMLWMGPFLFNACRFGAASVALFATGVRNGHLRSVTRENFRSGMYLGLFLSLGASLQQAGLLYTTAGKGGFITSLYMVIVPLLLLSLGHRVNRYVWLGVVCSGVGLFLLSAPPDLTINKGDVLVLLSAFAFAAHVIAAEKFTRSTDPFLLALIQYVICAVASFLISLFAEDVLHADLVGALPAILYGGLVSIGVGYTLQLAAQRHVPATPAALILSLESVFAAIAGAVLLGERLDTRQITGCSLMLLGIILSQFRTSSPHTETDSRT